MWQKKKLILLSFKKEWRSSLTLFQLLFNFLVRFNAMGSTVAIGGTICARSHSFLRIWSHLLKKSLMENFILCAVLANNQHRNWEENHHAKLSTQNCVRLVFGGIFSVEPSPWWSNSVRR